MEPIMGFYAIVRILLKFITTPPFLDRPSISLSFFLCWLVGEQFRSSQIDCQLIRCERFKSHFCSTTIDRHRFSTKIWYSHTEERYLRFCKELTLRRTFTLENLKQHLLTYYNEFWDNKWCNSTRKFFIFQSIFYRFFIHKSVHIWSWSCWSSNGVCLPQNARAVSDSIWNADFRSSVEIHGAVAESAL